MKHNDILFTDSLDSNNSVDEMKKFYKILYEEKGEELNKLILSNKEKYNRIKLNDLEELPDEFEEMVDEIKKFYKFISPKSLDELDIEIAKQNKKILDTIYKYKNQIKEIAKKETKNLLNENKSRQEKLKKIDYKRLDKKVLHEVLDIYTSLVLYNYSEEKNVYANYKKQLKIRKKINKIYKLINLEDNESNVGLIEILNKEIFKLLKKIYDKIIYLEDLMMEGSKYSKQFLEFKEYYSKLIAYDDESFHDVNNLYSFLSDNDVIEDRILELEQLFINERELLKKEEKFTYEKIGFKNFKISLDYISASYIKYLTEKDKQIIDELYSDLKPIVNSIWTNNLTDIYKYTKGSDFCFICTNNQFIDEKYEAILITKEMLERVEDYSNYQIGFICRYNNNILYITEKDNIMKAGYNDMSNLKTPKQIEQEFVNFRVRNRIALNGFVTKISAVYIINDGDFTKYRKAVELANQYNLPLIELKKDKS